jgi:hypothetical protein
MIDALCFIFVPQNFCRRAGGLSGLFAANRNYSDADEDGYSQNRDKEAHLLPAHRDDEISVPIRIHV